MNYKKNFNLWFGVFISNTVLHSVCPETVLVTRMESTDRYVKSPCSAQSYGAGTSITSVALSTQRSYPCCNCTCNLGTSYLTYLDACVADRKYRAECKLISLKMRNSTRCPSNGTKVFIEANHLQEGIKIAKCASLSRTLLDSNIVVSDCKILVDNTTYENNGWKRLWKTQEEVDFLIEKDPHGYEVVKWKGEECGKHKYDGLLISLSLQCKAKNATELSCMVLRISGDYTVGISPKERANASCSARQTLPPLLSTIGFRKSITVLTTVTTAPVSTTNATKSTEKKDAGKDTRKTVIVYVVVVILGVLLLLSLPVLRVFLKKRKRRLRQRQTRDVFKKRRTKNLRNGFLSFGKRNEYFPDPTTLSKRPNGSTTSSITPVLDPIEDNRTRKFSDSLDRFVTVEDGPFQGLAIVYENQHVTNEDYYQPLSKDGSKQRLEVNNRPHATGNKGKDSPLMYENLNVMSPEKQDDIEEQYENITEFKKSSEGEAYKDSSHFYRNIDTIFEEKSTRGYMHSPRYDKRLNTYMKEEQYQNVAVSELNRLPDSRVDDERGVGNRYYGNIDDLETFNERNTHGQRNETEYDETSQSDIEVYENINTGSIHH